MAEHEMVIAVGGAQLVLPAGGELSDAECDELCDAMEEIDFRQIVRQWIDDHASAPAVKVLVRSID